MFVKYLTPIDKVKELTDFINKVKDLSSLNSIHEHHHTKRIN